MITKVLLALAVGLAGQEATLSGARQADTMTNDRPRTAQRDTVQVSTVTNSATYTVTIDSIPVTYTADGSATAAEIRDGLIAAINGEPLLAGRVLASVKDADELYIDARLAGVGFVTTVDAKLTLANTTANADSASVLFGAGVFRTGEQAGCTADSALFTAATATVATLTPTVANSSVYSIGIVNPATGNTVNVIYTSDGSATAQEIVEGLATAVNAAMPANTVIATENDAVLTLTAEELSGGGYFRFNVQHSANQALSYTAGTYISEETEAEALFAGVALRTATEAPLSDGTLGYPGGSPMSVLSMGDVWVSTVDTVSVTGDVYLGVTGSARGKWRGTAASGYVKLPKRQARWMAVSGSLAMLRVRI